MFGWEKMLILESANLAGRAEEEPQLFYWSYGMTQTWQL